MQIDDRAPIPYGSGLLMVVQLEYHCLQSSVKLVSKRNMLPKETTTCKIIKDMCHIFETAALHKQDILLKA